ncbi:MAG TPA: DNA topoisomerase IV subunit B [Erysipelotrichaceae bacterium]|nr:DNA topoisomerase IV subunit B [Erysipelotrichaceae bacterium]
MSKVNQYDESSIQILEGLEAVRKRPGMYIGSTDSRGLHHLIWEILDNAIDEALNGYGKKIVVAIEKGDIIRIEDEGRGMPTGMHSSGVSTLEVIFRVLHAGGKFSSTGGYKTAGGLHGVGASVVNALSSWLEVTVNNHGKTVQLRFDQGGSKVSKLSEIGKSTKTGSMVRFKADKSIFTNAEYHYDWIAERVRESAFLLNGIAFTLIDERSNKQETFKYEQGLLAFMNYVNEDKSTLHKPFIMDGKVNEIDVAVAIQFTDSYQENIYSFVNLVRTKDGGTHEVGAKTAMTKVINEFARKAGLLKEKDKNFEGSDIREGLTVIISVGIPEHLLQFEGQTKGKLGTSEAKNAVENLMSEKLSFYLEENRNFSIELVKKIQKASLAREAARKAREEARKGKKNGKADRVLSGKLASAQTKNPKKNELFLVEGDSAGGSAKQGRDSKFQAILPLRGKVLNTEKASISDIEKNEELNTIIHALGAGVGAEFAVEDCNYDKVIIMTDADTDGAHIQVLLLTFFYRYMKPLIEAGKVYIAQPPLFKLKRGNKQAYAYDEIQLAILKEEMGKAELQRYKGLGEMNADQLWETTMDPQTRSLIQVTLDDGLSAHKKVSVLMGDKANLRRDWIESHVQFTLEESEQEV